MSSGRPKITQEVLDSIRVLYCAPETLAIYGIPYWMRDGPLRAQ